MIRVAIVGYGNIGKNVADAIMEAPDMTLVGVVRRSVSLSKVPSELENVKIVDDIRKLDDVQVAILCVPSRTVEKTAKEILALGISTVDSYDIHTSIWDLKQELDKVAKKNNSVSIISAGWDPGSDSIIRALLEAAAPKGITYTNFGPGMSMGHTVAVKSISGIKDALSITIPLGTGIHRRMVYVELENGVSFAEIENTIKNDPYFIKDETHVMQVSNVDELKDMGHAVFLTRKGVSGKTQNQLFEFSMKINNPALTAQILVSCARAATNQNAGCYTMIEIPLIDLLAGEREKNIKRLV
jgi:diaminopimelate dehydrogenase